MLENGLKGLAVSTPRSGVLIDAREKREREREGEKEPRQGRERHRAISLARHVRKAYMSHHLSV